MFPASISFALAEMDKLDPNELEALDKSVSKIAGDRKVIAVCVYGSKIAGYNRKHSDLDTLVIVEKYSRLVKYAYVSEKGVRVSILLVDRLAVEKDAKHGLLGEFVIGRLLHVYQAIRNPDFLRELEVLYKKRIILEYLQDLVAGTRALSTEISFHLESIMFSKIKQRRIIYPYASYSFYYTYVGDNSAFNTDFSIRGYRQALNELLDDGSLLVKDPHSELIRVSSSKILVRPQHNVVSSRVTKRLHEFTSYLVHAYAGRKSLHHAVAEAESKLRRKEKATTTFPSHMEFPKDEYWKLPEGILILEYPNWADRTARYLGYIDYSLSERLYLGAIRGRTTACVLLEKGDPNKEARTLVVKRYERMKRLNLPVRDRLLYQFGTFSYRSINRLSTEYKALRYLRTLGLKTPAIQAIVLTKRLMITDYVEGKTFAHLVNDYLCGRIEEDIIPQIYHLGCLFSIVHDNSCSFRSIRPDDVILKDNDIYFTGLEHFCFETRDQYWDLAEFICHSLGSERDDTFSRTFVKEFLNGYSHGRPNRSLNQLKEGDFYFDALRKVAGPEIIVLVKTELSKL